MKNKKIVSLVAAGALLANLALVAAVSAQTDTTLDQEITQGTLAITQLPTVSSWSDVNVALTAQTSDVSAGANTFKFQDMRGMVGTTYAVTTLGTDLLDIPSGVTFPITNLNIRTNGGSATMNDQSNSAECAAGEARNGYVNQALTATWTARDTDSKARAMMCEGTPDFQLAIPAKQSKGSYRTTVTWAIA